MRAAILGSNGYLGRHLVYYLDKLDWDITCFGAHDNLNSKYPYHKLDVTNLGKVGQINWDYDFVFYFVGLTGTMVAFDRYKDFIDVNETGLLNVITTIKKGKNKAKIVFPSTRLVYKGIEKMPLKENAEKEFKTIYASSKFNGELYLEMYRRSFGLDYTVFRICVPYGNLFDTNFSYGTIGFFLDNALKNGKITLFGDGSLKRTFTHVLDICKQIVEVSLLPVSNGECYNIEGQTFSLREVASLIGERYSASLEYLEWPDAALKLESGDTIFDAGKIKMVMTDSLQHSLENWINS
jgi:UDP-glucose 4-epimerase